MNWIKVTDWKTVPVGSTITAWDVYNEEPYESWYSGANKNTFEGLTDHTVIFFNRRTGYVGEYTFPMIQAITFCYLQEYEPYDPNGEPEDDCL